MPVRSFAVPLAVTAVAVGASLTGLIETEQPPVTAAMAAVHELCSDYPRLDDSVSDYRVLRSLGQYSDSFGRLEVVEVALQIDAIDPRGPIVVNAWVRVDADGQPLRWRDGTVDLHHPQYSVADTPDVGVREREMTGCDVPLNAKSELQRL